MPKRQEQNPYTPEILARADALHGSGLVWEVVAERIGHTHGSLMSTRSQRKRDTNRKTRGERRAKSEREMAYVEALISLGTRPKEMQSLLKLTGAGVSMRLLNWGLDREERVALRLADETFASRLAEARALFINHETGPLTQKQRGDLRELKNTLLRGSELRRVELEALLRNPLPLQVTPERSDV